jgi:hypothetical protein
VSLRRLRWSEWLAGGAAVVLAVSIFGLHWYGGGAPRNGWAALPLLRWPLLVTAVLVLVTALAQMRPGPGLSAALDVPAAVLSVVMVILLAIRLAGTGATLAVGAYVGLCATVAMSVGMFVALRTERGWTPGRDRAVDVVSQFPRGEG